MRVQVLLLLLLTAGSATTAAWAATSAGAAAAQRAGARANAQAHASGAASAQAAARGQAAEAGRKKAAGGTVQKGAVKAGQRGASAASKQRAGARRPAGKAREQRFEPYVIQNWPEAALAGIPSVWTEIPPAPAAPTSCRVCETYLLASAYEQIGIRYRLGGTRPETGFDCSGLMKYLFEKNFQIALPPTAPQQFQFGLRVEKWELEPGDLVFFRTRRGWHVGMYVGNDSFLHAPNRRKTVRVSALFSDPYWRRAYVGGRRVPLPEPGVMVAGGDLSNNNN